MSGDLIVLAAAVGLSLVVVLLGSRRDLGDTTRSWLPRFGKDPESADVGPVASVGEGGRRPLTPLQRRLLAGMYLFFATYNAVSALSWADDPLFRGLTAVVFTGCAVVLVFQGRRAAAEKSPSASA